MPLHKKILHISESLSRFRFPFKLLLLLLLLHRVHCLGKEFSLKTGFYMQAKHNIEWPFNPMLIFCLVFFLPYATSRFTTMYMTIIETCLDTQELGDI